MKYLILIILTGLAFVSCNKNESNYTEQVDTLRGVYGEVLLYNTFGDELGGLDGVAITAHVIDTLATDSIGQPTNVLDTTISTVTFDGGKWEILDEPKGFYTIEFESEGFGSYTIYKHWHDTTSTDTLDVVYLAKSPNASIEIDSVTYANGLINLYRTVTYIESRVDDYAVTTWYFFDTTSNVSSSSYVYAYVSGAAYGNAGEAKSLTTQKPIDKLFESSFKEGDSVYVRAYVDNLHYQSYQVSDKTIAYPNITGESSVKAFVILPEE